jgi:DNA invertase Pin-like site-specific DNA recombinase
MSNCVVLLRVSTKNQAESKTGLMAQKNACLDFAEKNNLVITEIISEAGVSGATPIDKRDGLIRALSLLNSGDTLLVSKYDRLSRSHLDQMLIEKAIGKKRAKLVAVDNQNAAANDPTSTLLRRLLSSIAEYERELIKSRVRQAHNARRRAGLICGHPPYGYTRGHNDELVVNPDELAVWERVEELRSSPHGKKKYHSWRVVAEKLNEEGFKNRSGRPWTYANLFQIQKTRNDWKGLI